MHELEPVAETRRAGPVAGTTVPPNVWRILGCVALVGLVALGVASVVLRLVFPADAASQLEPIRQAIVGAGGTSDQRLGELAEFDRRFAANRGITALHIIPGGLFLILLPLQLSGAVRRRLRAFHRWNGRLLIAVGTLSTVPALYFAIAMPFGGVAELVVIVPVAVWFLVSMLRAYRAIKRRDIDTHRRWMLRAIAAPIGVTVVRLVGPIADLSLTPLGASARDTFVAAVCIGWALTFVATEWWIRRASIANGELSFPMK